MPEEHRQAAERLLISEMTSEEDAAAKEMMERQLESMRLEIAGQDALLLERVLRKRTVATWLQVQLFESLYATSLGKQTLPEVTITRSFWTGHTSGTLAIRTLARTAR